MRFQFQLRYGKIRTTFSEQGIPVTISDVQSSELSNDTGHDNIHEDGERRVLCVTEGQAFLPRSGANGFEGLPPAYC